MATEQGTKAASTQNAQTARRSNGRLWTWLWTAVGVGAVVAVGWNARNQPDERIGNPKVVGTPRPFAPLFGFRHWIPILQIFTVVAVVVLIAAAIWGWRRYGPHPYLLMGLVTTIIVWQDPMMNWAPYAVYDPRLWHWPEWWPYVSLAPTVEPFVVFGYVMFQFGPYFPAVWALRRIQARRGTDAFVWRHPLVSLGLLIFIFGFVIDMILEVTMIQTGLYMYSQVIPFGSIFAGTPHQFPLLWESSLVTLVMIPAGVLVYRDDTGRAVAEKLANRARIFPTRPALGSFVMMLVIVNMFYLVYGLAFASFKWTRIATSVACPWPYPEAKVYDPQGFYEQNGQEGPYSVGIWSGWMMAQPEGRPVVTLGSIGDRCAADKHR